MRKTVIEGIWNGRKEGAACIYVLGLSSVLDCCMFLMLVDKKVSLGWLSWPVSSSKGISCCVHTQSLCSFHCSMCRCTALPLSETTAEWTFMRYLRVKYKWLGGFQIKLIKQMNKHGKWTWNQVTESKYFSRVSKEVFLVEEGERNWLPRQRDGVCRFCFRG